MNQIYVYELRFAVNFKRKLSSHHLYKVNFSFSQISEFLLLIETESNLVNGLRFAVYCYASTTNMACQRILLTEDYTGERHPTVT